MKIDDKMKQEFDHKIVNYEKLGSELKKSIEGLLLDANIDYYDVDYRIKSCESFKEKIERKNYKHPFEEILDICGIRIICFYLSDIEKINEIIRSEFNIKEDLDKSKELDVDKFGYRSHHFVAKIVESWTITPQFRGLDALFFEVQIRTILMHSWATIDHKLQYKKEKDIPIEIRRKLFRLSALIEMSDEEFNDINTKRKTYSEKLITLDENNNEKKFKIDEELNLDSLQTFLDYHFPNRFKDIERTSDLLYEINQTNLNMQLLNSYYEKSKDKLILLENEVANIFGRKSPMWTQVAIISIMLSIFSKDYFFNRMPPPPPIIELLNKYKKELGIS